MPAANKTAQPKIQNATIEEIPVVEEGNVKVRIIAGQILGETGPLNTTVPVIALYVISQSGGHLSLSALPQNDNALIYVLVGGVRMEGRRVDEF